MGFSRWEIGRVKFMKERVKQGEIEGRERSGEELWELMERREREEQEREFED